MYISWSLSEAAKVHMQVSTHPHPSLLKDFPLGLIRLTLFHKLPHDHLQKRENLCEHLFNLVSMGVPPNSLST